MKNFKSTDGTTKRIALTNGHVFLIGTEWQSIPEFAYSEAYSQQCISEDMITGTATAQVAVEVMSKLNNEALAKEKLKDCILKAVRENNQDFFSKINNSPKISAIREILGKHIQKHTVDMVWFEMKEDVDDIREAQQD